MDFTTTVPRHDPVASRRTETTEREVVVLVALASTHERHGDEALYVPHWWTPLPLTPDNLAKAEHVVARIADGWVAKPVVRTTVTTTVVYDVPAASYYAGPQS